MRSEIPTAVLSLVAGASLRAGVVTVDLDAWARMGTGVTAEGWSVSGVDAYGDLAGARLNTKDEYALSPVYAGAVTQLVMSVRASSASTTRFLSAVPEVAKEGAQTLSAQATESCTEQRLVWRKDEDVRQFRLKNIGSGRAGWAIHELRVCVDSVEPPRPVVSDIRYCDALTARWVRDGRAVAHDFELSEIETFPPRGTKAESWDFSILTNATGRPLAFADVPLSEKLAGVSGDFLNVQVRSGGYLQAGNTKGAGRLVLRLASTGPRLSILRLFRSAASGTDGPVSIVSVGADGTTNALSAPILTTVPQEYSVPLPEDARELIVGTAVKSRRICITDVTIVADYAAGFATTNLLVRRRTARDDFTAKGLAPGDYVWRVRSYDLGGTVSGWSSFVCETLLSDDPPRPVQGLLLWVR